MRVIRVQKRPVIQIHISTQRPAATNKSRVPDQTPFGSYLCPVCRPFRQVGMGFRTRQLFGPVSSVARSGQSQIVLETSKLSLVASRNMGFVQEKNAIGSSV